MPCKCCINIDECSSSTFGFSLSHFSVAGQTRASEPTASLLQKVPGDPYCSQSAQVLSFISSHRQLHWQEKCCLQYCTVLPPGCNTVSTPGRTQETGLHTVPWQALFLPGLFAELSRVKLSALEKILDIRHQQNCWENSCSKLGQIINGKNKCMS